MTILSIIVNNYYLFNTFCVGRCSCRNHCLTVRTEKLLYYVTWENPIHPQVCTDNLGSDTNSKHSMLMRVSLTVKGSSNASYYVLIDHLVCSLMK